MSAMTILRPKAVQTHAPYDRRERIHSEDRSILVCDDHFTRSPAMLRRDCGGSHREYNARARNKSQVPTCVGECESVHARTSPRRKDVTRATRIRLPHRFIDGLVFQLDFVSGSNSLARLRQSGTLRNRNLSG